MAERRRIALVLATSTGGVGRHVRSLAAELTGEAAVDGDRVAVLGPAATERHFRFTESGARFAPVEIASGLRPVADVAAVVRLRRLTRRAQIVHAHGLRAGFVAACALAGAHTPLVVTLHNMPPGEGAAGGAPTRIGHGPVALAERFVARRARVILAASDDLAERARALGGRDVRFAPVAAPALLGGGDSLGVRTRLGAADRPLIVAVGRLHRQKGFDVLVEAAARWAELAASPLVVIAGSGPDEARLSEQIARRGAPVRLLGHRDDVAALLAAADVAVLPSRWEARALAAQEALVAGVPLVATAVGGIPDLVGDAALLVPPEDVDALDRAVRRVLAGPELRAELARRAREQASTWPDEHDTARDVAAVYRQLVLP